VEAGPPLEAWDRCYWLIPPRSANFDSERLSTWLVDEVGRT
ncbi:LysR family transcriptional regulator, partial [Rhizobium brockwellii]